jgi:hypothetical protein
MAKKSSARAGEPIGHRGFGLRFAAIDPVG